MRITYVLPTPEFNGGNKVALQHARLLESAGDEVRVLAYGARPDWGSVSTYHDLGAGRPAIPSQDLVIATYWTSLAVARELDLGPRAHFCQGYEGWFSHLLAERAEIERQYAERLPTLVVTPALAALLAERHGRASRVAPPPLDRAFRPRRFTFARRRPWIAVPGIYEAEVKDVPTALAAVEELRRRGLRPRLLRFSTHPIGAAERSRCAADLELVGAPPARVAAALRACELLLFPSRPEEGFGLPLLEAMASGVPAVASRIPSTEFIAGDAVALVEPANPAAFAAAADELLGDRRRWRAARRRGLAAAERFAPEQVAELLFAAVRWAAAGGPSATHPA